MTMHWLASKGNLNLEKKVIGSMRVGSRVRVEMETHVAFATNHFFAVIFACERFERGFDNAAAETEHKMKS